MTTTYDRPVKATLIVRLDNGDEFEAGPDDLAKFGYVSRSGAYAAFNDYLAGILVDAGLIERHKDITSARINDLRYIAELAICHPALLSHPDLASVNARIVEIEKTLREHLAEEQ